VELFHLAERWRLTLAEVPVEVENSERTTVRALRDGLRLVVDLMRVRQLARRGGYPAPAMDPSTAGSHPTAPAVGMPAPASEPTGADLGTSTAVQGSRRAAVGTVFKAYDIRGRVPEELDGSLAEAIGRAFALLVRDEEPDTTRVVVGRDMRPSGTLLGAAFAAGVTSEGLDVVDLGLASTDMLYFASGHLGVPGAVLTASHNPAGYNGIKLCLSAARPVGGDTGLDRMAARILAGFDDAVATGGGSTTSLEVLPAFVEHVRSFVDLDSLRPLSVVVDTANGMGGLVVPAVFDELPFHLDHLFAELDGTFPNHPADPIQPENLRDLQARVLETGADIGLAFDGDADRVFLVDERARPVSGSTTTALVARGVLRRHPGATVLHNLICSRAVPEVIAECGGRAVRTRVGHSIIKQAMLEEGAVFAGEHSGHYYFRDNYRADSGLIAALVVLEALSDSDLPLSGLLAPFERYAASGERNSTVADPAAVIELVAGHYADEFQDRLDGLTVDLGDWWFNLRPSNTEPLLRLNVEAADDEACAARVAEVQALIDQ
jgi:phosphomannomutase